jgi:hypothetical protein
VTPLKNNDLAARMGRWSARHRKIAISGWLGVVVAILIGKAAGTIELKQNDAIPGESGHATRLIDREFSPRASETVLVQSTTLTADDRAFRVAVADVLASVRSFTIVVGVDSPYARGNGSQISADRHSALVNFEFKSSAEDAQNISKPVEDAVAAVQKAHSDLTIAEFGDGARVLVFRARHGATPLGAARACADGHSFGRASRLRIDAAGTRSVRADVGRPSLTRRCSVISELSIRATML